MSHFVLTTTIAIFTLFSPYLTAATQHGNKQKTSSFNSYLNSYSYSNIVPVAQLLNDHWQQTPDHSANIAFSQNELGVTYRHNNYQISLVKRIDIFINTTPATSQLYYHEKQQNSDFTMLNQALYAQLKQQNSTGVRLGYTWQFESFNTTLELGYWYLEQLRKTTVSGQASMVDRQYSGELILDEHYSDKNILKRPNHDSFNASGYGINANLAIHWQATSNIELDLTIKDLYSRYKITDLGYSKGQANTNNIAINANGYQTFLPIYRGIEVAKDYSTSLKPTTVINAIYHHNNASYLARVSQHFSTNFYQLGYQWPLSQADISVLIDVERFTPTLNYHSQAWDITLSMDKLNIHHSMNVNLGISYCW